VLVSGFFVGLVWGVGWLVLFFFFFFLCFFLFWCGVGFVFFFWVGLGLWCFGGFLGLRFFFWVWGGLVLLVGCGFVLVFGVGLVTCSVFLTLTGFFPTDRFSPPVDRPCRPPRVCSP